MEPVLLRALRGFPSLVLTGPRRAGKTTLLRRVVPKASYRLFEDPDVIARFRADPRGFLDELTLPTILDEVQNVPEIFSWVRARIDANPRAMGRYILTGSQEAPLMRGVSESMAGRAAVLALLPFSARETDRVTPFRGGFAEALARPRDADLWYSSYLQTYLERDVRAVTNVHDLSSFRRFLGLVASRHGQTLNKTDLAAPLGVSVPTITSWLSVLEATAQIFVVPPYFENAGKRLTKAPKMFVADSGLACHLLGLRSAAELERSPFLGAVLEGHVAAEIQKSQSNRGARRELFHFRDQQGLEVDFVFPGASGVVQLVEVKATRTPTPSMATSLERLRDALLRTDARRAVEALVVHRAARTSAGTHVLTPNVRTATFEAFVAGLGQRRPRR